jgi:hypothetical protein
MQQWLSIAGILGVVAGVIVLVFAKRLSMFERRMVEKHPGTRVTGWSGTRKGTLAWRAVGIMLIVLGGAQQFPYLLRN